MSSERIRAAEVRLGDRLRTRSGVALTVTRVDEEFLGRPEKLAFVEDSKTQGLKMPAPREGEVDLVRRAPAGSAADRSP